MSQSRLRCCKKQHTGPSCPGSHNEHTLYIYVHMGIQMYVCIFEYVNLYLRVNVCACNFVCVCVYICTHLYICTYTCLYTHIYIFAYLHTYVYTFTHIHMHTYIYICILMCIYIGGCFKGIHPAAHCKTGISLTILTGSACRTPWAYGTLSTLLEGHYYDWTLHSLVVRETCSFELVSPRMHASLQIL